MTRRYHLLIVSTLALCLSACDSLPDGGSRMDTSSKCPRKLNDFAGKRLLVSLPKEGASGLRSIKR
ncbi:hypothetical protein [Parachitinimonas caeni]|uniref:Lipoprotein n=1 Tax=Parachitinimonas caeni TaxID=3031301 RepID=A0ABT7DSG4_9NEIS|nr:hypothetical protein [Parachitinimonas caeni]MDK2123007.1 hypothetical protein [Parachitinimonas caeni]